MGASLALCLMTGSAWAITSDNVIQMHKSGLPANVIIQTIQSTGSTFTLKVSDLAALEKAGVPAAVIEAMMASSGGGGAPAPEPAPEPAPAPEVDELDQMRQSEEAEKAKLEEDGRIRQAAQRAADAERLRLAAIERKRISAALAAARGYLEEKKYVDAVKSFDEFLKSADDTSASAAAAKLGKADALSGLGLNGNACALYHELLSTGADSDVFQPAFLGLRACARRLAYSPVTLEAMTNYFVGNAPVEFRDSYNYFLGKFFFDYNRYDEARRYLGEVSDAGEDYADSQYLLGLIGVQEAGEDQESELWLKTLIGANQHFQWAVQASSANEPRVRYLAYLALARIAYSIGQFDAAIYYYRKVPNDSTSYVDALHEAGWSYFLKGDTRRGMGIFHTLDGPDWTNYYLPDTHLLEATVFTNKCHFGYALDAIKRIEGRYLALNTPLEKFLGEYASPEAMYSAFVLKKIRNGVELPRLARMAVISSNEFYDLYTTTTELRREVANIKRERDVFGAELSGRLLDQVETQYKENTIALGIKLTQLLSGLQDSLVELEVQVTEIRIEMDEAEATELQAANADILKNKGEDSLTDDAESQVTASLLVGANYHYWPFEGEYWSDEINNFRSNLSDVCKQR